MDNLFETKEMPGTFRKVREELLKTFPKERIEGLNLRRVENFIKSLGLELKPYVIFDREQLSTVKEIEGNTRLLRDGFDNGQCGLYSPEMDLVLIARDRDYEESSGSIYTEGLLAHELAHASSMYQGYITLDNIRFYTPRMGFCLPRNKIPWGWFFEEGWADMIRGKYIMRYSTPQDVERLRKALRRSRVSLSDTVYVTTPVGTLTLPIKYVYVEPNGRPTTKSSAFAAFGIEILCRAEPKLYEVMIKARYSVDSLRKLGRVVDKISPGLYSILSRTDYTEEDFYRKLKLVISKVGGGLNQVAQRSW